MSHSAMPILSPALAVVVGVPAGTGVLALEGAAFRFVSACFAQASSKRPVRMHIMSNSDFDIGVLPDSRMVRAHQ